MVGCAPDNVDRTPKPCPHGKHKHGSHLTYRYDGCRCIPCRDANAKLVRDRRHRKYYGKEMFVDPGPAVAHVKLLKSYGMGQKRISEIAGFHVSHVICNGSAKMIRRDISEAILAVRLDLPDFAKVDATGSRRRLQALLVRGWHFRLQSQHSGLGQNALNRISNGQPTIYMSTARAIYEMYEDLRDVTPVGRTWSEERAIKTNRNNAIRKHYISGDRWSDSSIDDPNATPLANINKRPDDDYDFWVVEQTVAGRRPDYISLTKSESMEIVRRLDSDGLSVNAIINKANIHRTTVLSHLEKIRAEP